LTSQALPLPNALRWRDGLTFAVVLAFLLVPWPGLGAGCAGAFAGILNFLGAERVLDSGIALHLEPVGSPAGGQIHASPLWHVFIIATDVTGATRSMAFNTRGAFYVPTATFVAFLAAARGWRWPHPGRALVAGILVVLSFTLLSTVTAMVSFLARPGIEGITLGEPTRIWLEALFLGWFAPPGMGYGAALLAGICALVAGRGLDLSASVARK